MAKAIVLVIATAVLAINSASATDLPAPKAPTVRVVTPAPVKKVEEPPCVYVEVKVLESDKRTPWADTVVFRVTAKDERIPGGFIQTPAKKAPGVTKICVPRAFFGAPVVEICLGNRKKTIQGDWMKIARANLAKGNVVNPGQPMEFFSLDSDEEESHVAHRVQRPVVNRSFNATVSVGYFPNRPRQVSGYVGNPHGSVSTSSHGVVGRAVFPPSR